MADDFQSKAAELMKKMLTIGVGTLFLTEESLRGLISEFKLPKEMIAAVLDSAQKTKKEFLESLSQEVMSKFMNRVDPKTLFDDLLQKYNVEVNIKLGFKRKKEE